MSAFLHLVVLVVASIGVPLAADPAHAATTFAINRTGDAGDRRLADAACASSRERGKQCTLRAAMEEANDTPGADGIRFNIASRASVKTISLARPLPSITEALTIDGYTQRGARANTLATGSDAVLKIQLNGTNADTAAVPEANGLTILAAGSTVEGLAINRFSGDGIQLSASDGTVQGNYLGTNASGTQKLGNNNVVFVNGTNNTIGGTAAGARNLLSGNDSYPGTTEPASSSSVHRAPTTMSHLQQRPPRPLPLRRHRVGQRGRGQRHRAQRRGQRERLQRGRRGEG